jgi:hypothetical protein
MKVQPTVKEIIGLLKKTSLPTIVVEGSDDIIVYRRLEERLCHLGISVLPAGGRENVLSIFDRRHEIPAGLKLAFIADQDIWVHTGVPLDYQHAQLVLTSGYSVENDVFQDGRLLNLLTPRETSRFTTELKTFVEWYSLAIDRHLKDRAVAISLHPNHVLDPARFSALVALADGEKYPAALRQRVHDQYATVLRGKSLMDLFIRNTNYSGRVPRYSSQVLLEIVSVNPGTLLQKITSQVESALTI